MRPILLVGFALLSTLARGEVTMSVTVNGVPSGTVRWSVRVNGKERVDQKVINEGPKAQDRTITTHWNSKGLLMKVEYVAAATSITFGRVTRGRTMITSVFPEGKDGETTIRVPGRTIKQPTGTPPASAVDESAFWFVRDHPAANTTVDFATFDVLNLKWQNVERTFLGRKPVPNGVYAGEANAVKETVDGVESLQFWSDNGEPIYIVSGTTVMVRQ